MAAPRVLITGVSGFLGSWTARAASKLGYQVRGTVRSMENAERMDYIRSVVQSEDNPNLEIVEANMNNPDAITAAMEGCDYIIHTAHDHDAAYISDDHDDANSLGIKTILKNAASQENKPKGIVMSSCLSTSIYTTDKKQKSFSNKDWTVRTERGLTTSVVSKTRAEAVAWKYVKTRPEAQRPNFVTINGGFMLGPTISKSPHSSFQFLSGMIGPEQVSTVDMRYNVSYVHDIARACLLSMRTPAAFGQRMLTTSMELSAFDFSRILGEEVEKYGYKLNVKKVNKFKLHFISLVNEPAMAIYPQVGLSRQIDCSIANEILGLKWNTDATAMVRDTILSAVQAGLLPENTVGDSIRDNYVTPDIDIEGIPKATDLI